jgi:hypothetical protein
MKPSPECLLGAVLLALTCGSLGCGTREARLEEVGRKYFVAFSQCNNAEPTGQRRTRS